MTNLHLFAEKVAVEAAAEEMEGSIILPENRKLKFEMGRVIATGDGKYRDGEQRELWVKPGDIVMYQLGGPQIENSKFKQSNGKAARVFHQGDIIAKLDSCKVNMNTFHIVGNWVLLEVKMDQGVIIIPEKIAPSEDFRFVVTQKGAGVTIPIEVGQEVFPERGRCLPIEINSTTFVYTHQDFLHGALVQVPDAVVEDAVPSPQA